MYCSILNSINLKLCYRWLSIPFEGDGRMPRDRPGIGQYNGHLIVAGGSMERNLLATVEKYDTQDRTWSR